MVKDGNQWCSAGCTRMVSSKRKRGGVTLCATCDPISKPRRVEILLREKLARAIDHPFSAADDTLFGQTCDVTKKRRPDLLWLGEDRCILVEVDERGGHSDPSYTPECDFGWAMDMVHCLVQLYRERGRNGGRVPHIVLLRYNPDEYDGGRVTEEERLCLLVERIVHHSTRAIPPTDAPVPEIEYYFYHSKCDHFVSHAQRQVGAARVAVFPNRTMQSYRIQGDPSTAHTSTGCDRSVS